jgi:hypothetical protein
MSVKPKEVREARAFLQKRGFSTGDIPPRLFASAAKQMNKSFSDLLKEIARLQLGGQGQGQAPDATRIAEKG